VVGFCDNINFFPDFDSEKRLKIGQYLLKLRRTNTVSSFWVTLY